MSSTLYPTLSLLLSGARILYDPSPKQQETKDGFWSALTTLPSELKQNHWRTLRTWMPKGLCGRTLSLDLGSLIPSSRTTGFSLIAKWRKKKTKQNKEGGVWDPVNKRKERKTKWKKKVWEMKFWQNCRKVKNGGNL